MTTTAYTKPQLDAIDDRTEYLCGLLTEQLLALGFTQTDNLTVRSDVSVAMLGHRDGMMAVLTIGAAPVRRFILTDEADVAWLTATADSGVIGDDAPAEFTLNLSWMNRG